MWSIETLGTRKKSTLSSCVERTLQITTKRSERVLLFLVRALNFSFPTGLCVSLLQHVLMKLWKLSPWSIATLSCWKHVEPFALISRVVSSSQRCDCLTASKRIEIFGKDNFLAPPVHFRTMHSALQRKFSWLSSGRKTFRWRCQGTSMTKLARVLIKIFEKSMYLVSTLLERPQTLRTWNIKTGLREGWNASDTRVSNYSFREISEDW